MTRCICSTAYDNLKNIKITAEPDISADYTHKSQDISGRNLVNFKL